MGRKKKIKEKDLLCAIYGCRGFVTTVAKRLACEWHTADIAIKASEKARRAMEDENETTLDFVEGKAIERIKEGDGSMIRFILATKGRKRGYGEKPVIDESVAEDSELRIVIDDDKQ